MDKIPTNTEMAAYSQQQNNLHVCQTCGKDLVRKINERPSQFRQRIYCNYACSKTKHGGNAGGKCSSEYQTWKGIIKRCHNPKSQAWPEYGGRGIIVCDRWRHSFERFHADMGPRPTSRHSIDRIDNDGNYDPGNCRWATASQQGSNKRNNHLISFNGVTKTVSQWSRECGINLQTLLTRLRKGVPTETALMKPRSASNA